MRFRSVLLCAGMCAAIGFAALGLHAQEPASYPHDMSDYGCTNRDENACDSGAGAAARLHPARRHLGQVFAAAQRLQRVSRPTRRCMSSS